MISASKNQIRLFKQNTESSFSRINHRHFGNRFHRVKSPCTRLGILRAVHQPIESTRNGEWTSRSSSSKGLGIGALGKAAAVSPDTIRHYARVGVLPRGRLPQSLVIASIPPACWRELVSLWPNWRKSSNYAMRVESPVNVFISLRRKSSRVSEPTKYLRSVLADWEKRLQGHGANHTCCIRSMRISGSTARVVSTCVPRAATATRLLKRVLGVSRAPRALNIYVPIHDGKQRPNASSNLGDP